MLILEIVSSQYLWPVTWDFTYMLGYFFSSELFQLYMVNSKNLIEIISKHYLNFNWVRTKKKSDEF